MSVQFAVCSAGLDTPEATATQLAAQGVRAIETSPEFFLNADDRRIREVARVFRDNGIRLRSVHAPFGNEHNLSSPNSAIRASAVDEHARLLRQCAAAEIYCVVFHAGTDETKDRPRDAAAWAIESLSALVAVAKETGARIALENLLPGYPGCAADELLDIVAAVDSTLLGVCFDSGHAHVAGAMAATLERVKDRVITFHLHDNDGKGDLHYQPPFGTIDWESFVKVFRTMGFGDAVTVEAAPWAKGGWSRLLDDVTRLLAHFEERIAGASAK